MGIIGTGSIGSPGLAQLPQFEGLICGISTT
jgi:hypothetical protein